MISCLVCPTVVALHLDQSLTLGEYLGRVVLSLGGIAATGVLILGGLRVVAAVRRRRTVIGTSRRE